MNRERLYEEIKADEGEVLEVYLDHLGYPTIGIGHLVTAEDEEFGNSVVESDSDQGLSLPPELWYFILQFVNRLDMRSQGRAVSKRRAILKIAQE